MKQSEIWLVNLDPTTGAEIKKSRPCVIINNSKFGRLPLKVVVPFTDWKEAYDSVSWMIRISPDAANGLSKESAIDCFQIRSLSEQRLIRRLGRITPEMLARINDIIAEMIAA